jgi:hypothetical protein
MTAMPAKIGHRARLSAIRKLPAASHCCIPAQHATTRPYLPCQCVPRRPGRSRCTRPQTPSAMSSLSDETSRNGPANASRPFRTILTGRAASASLVRRLHRRTLQDPTDHKAVPSACPSENIPVGSTGRQWGSTGRANAWRSTAQLGGRGATAFARQVPSSPPNRRLLLSNRRSCVLRGFWENFGQPNAVLRATPPSGRGTG